jgi:hypothetical protein
MDEEPKYLRCECGKLLTDRMISKGVCAGHRVKYATKGSFIEWLKIKLNLVK